MSFIRGLSNPESLYIYGSFEGKVHISVGTDHERTMPLETFIEILRLWWRDGDILDIDEQVEYKGASIVQSKDFRWSLYYPGWKSPVVMWEATLYYLCSTNKHRWSSTKRRR